MAYKTTYNEWWYTKACIQWFTKPCVQWYTKPYTMSDGIKNLPCNGVQKHIKWVMVYKAIPNDNPPKPPNARWAERHRPPIVRSTKISRHVRIRTNIGGSLGMAFVAPRSLMYLWPTYLLHVHNPENFPGRWRGRTLWSAYGSMVTNNDVLPYARRHIKYS